MMRAAALALAASLLIGGLVVVLQSRRCGYDDLHLGMQRSEIEACLGIAERTVLYRDGRISFFGINDGLWLFSEPMYDPTPQPPRRVASFAEIPSYYASIECLTDKDDRVVALVVAGETKWIETAQGRVAGNEIRSLSPAVFDELTK